MKRLLWLPVLLAPLTALPAIAQSENCTSFWINPKTQQPECFGNNLTPMGPPVALPPSTRPSGPRENRNQEPLRQLELIRRAQSSYVQKIGSFTTEIKRLDQAFRTGQLGQTVLLGLEAQPKPQSIPATTAKYVYQIQLATTVQRQGRTYLVYTIGATARQANLRSYVAVLLSTVEKSLTSDAYVVCKSQTAKASIPNNFLTINAQQLGAIAQQIEAFEAKYADSVPSPQMLMDQEMQAGLQMMQRITSLLQCPPGFSEANVGL